MNLLDWWSETRWAMQAQSPAVRALRTAALEPRILLNGAPADAAALAGAETEQVAVIEDPAAFVGELSQTQTNSEEQRRELILLDRRVPEAEALLSLLEETAASREVIWIEADDDLAEITDAVRTASTDGDFDAIHLFSHGDTSGFELGSERVDATTIDSLADEFRDWRDLLTADGDFLLYGCHIAETSVGRDLVAELADLTGADVAASDDLTGHEALGGDWDLELEVGAIETTAYAALDWQHTLTTGTVTFQEGVNGYTGTEDSYFDEDSPDDEKGTDDHIHSQTEGGRDEHGYLKFDDIFGSGANQVPLGSTITGATLTLDVQNDTTGTITFHQLLTAVDESDTWNSLTNGIQRDGAEAAAAASFSVDATSGGPVAISDPALTSVLQDWLDGTSTNHGFAIFNTSDDQLHFETSDQNEVAKRPQMSITYSTPSIVTVTNALDTAANGDTSSIAALIADDGGDGISLREALAAAANTAGHDTINFNIGTGQQTITLMSGLNTISDVTIDATTQTGYVDQPLIMLTADGGYAGNGLTLQDSVTVKGLSIVNMSGHGIEVLGSNNTLHGNWIGQQLDGTARGNGAAGIMLSGGGEANNVIGGVGLNQGNVIVNNSGGGVVVNSGTDHFFRNNVIENNSGLGNVAFGSRISSSDYNDGDTGENGLLNQPAIFSIVPDGTNYNVTVYVQTKTNTTVTLDLLSASSANTRESTGVVTSQDVTTNDEGFAVHTFTVAASSLPVGTVAFSAQVLSDEGSSFLVRSVGLPSAGAGNVATSAVHESTVNSPDFRGERRTSTRSIAVGNDGKQYVVWTEDDGAGSSVYGRLFNADGTARTAATKLNDTTGTHHDASVSVDASGRFVVVWADQDNNEGWFRQINASGTTRGDATELYGAGTVGSTQYELDVVSLPTGEFFISWSSRVLGDTELYIVGYSSTGNDLHFPVTLTQGLGDTPRESTIAINSAGVITAAWEENDGIHLRQFNTLTQQAVGSDTLLGNGDDVAITALPDGRFFLAIADESTSPGAQVAGQFLNSDGTTDGARFRIDEMNGATNARNVSVSADHSGRIAVAYQNGGASNAFYKVLDSTGAELVGQTDLPANQSNVQLAGQVAFHQSSDTLWLAYQGFNNDAGAAEGVWKRAVSIPLPSGGNQVPIANAGGPYTINEGASLTLDASGSTDPNGHTLTYKWDLDNDGNFDEAGDPTGVDPTVSWSTLQSLGINDDGTYTVGLQVDDGNGGVVTTTTTLTVNDVAPTIAVNGTGSATTASAYTLSIVATDPGDDTISGWIINWGDGQVQNVAGNPGTVTHTYAGAGQTYNVTVAAVNEDGTWFNNDLIVSSGESDSLFRFDPVTGDFAQQFGVSDTDSPINTVIGPDGLLYVGGWQSDNVERYNATTGARVDTFVTAGSGGLASVGGMTFGLDGDLYVSSYDTDQILRYNGTNGAFEGIFVAAGTGGLDGAADLVFLDNGDLLVSSFLTDEVLRFNSSGGSLGAFVAAGSGGLDEPEGMTFGPDGNLYVASYSSDEILRYDGTTGASMGAFVSSGSGGLDGPLGMTWGPDGNLYVGSERGDEVLRYNGSTGAFIDVYASGNGLNGPQYAIFVPSHQVAVTGTSVTNTIAVHTAAATNPDFRGDYRTSSRAIAVANDGKHYVVWTQDDGGNTSIYGRLFNTDGTPATAVTKLNESSGAHGDASVDVDDAGRYIVSWTNQSTNNGQFRYLTDNGLFQTGEQAIDLGFYSGEREFDVVKRPTGEVIFTWNARLLGQEDQHIVRYDANGVWQSGSGAHALSAGLGDDPREGSLAVDARGIATVAWIEPGGVHVRQYNATNHSLVGSDTVIGSGTDVVVAALSDGRFFLAITDSSEIFGQFLNADGSADGARFRIDEGGGGSGAIVPTVAAASNGRIAIGYENGDGNRSYYKVIDETGSTVIAETEAPENTGGNQQATGVAFTADGLKLWIVYQGDNNTVGEAGVWKTSVAVAAPPSNAVPVANAGGPYTIAEGAGVTLDASGSTDGDSDTLTYKWDLDNDGDFDEAGEPTGVSPTVTWATLNSFGINTDGTFTIGVQANDGNGGIHTATTTLDVTNSNVGAVSDNNTATNTVAENASVGTVVGLTATASDVDPVDTVTYSLTNNAGGRFAINVNTGVVTVAGALNFESNASHEITVLATSTDTSTTSKSFTIAVTNINEAPSITGPSSVNVSDDATPGTALATFPTTDPDAGGSPTWSVIGTGPFTMGGNSLILDGALDANVTALYSLTIRVTDAVGLTDDHAITVNVNDSNQSPTLSGPASATIADDLVTGTVVATYSATDPNAGDTLSYSTTGTTAFAINAATGELTVNETLNADAQATHTFTVSVSDGNGGVDSQSVTITLTDTDSVTGDIYQATKNATFVTDSAYDWWNTDWSTRQRIRINNLGIAEQSQVPIPLILNATNFDYSAAKADGSDLRIISPNHQSLHHEIETWNPGGESIVWVKIGSVGTSGLDFFDIYYGNAAADDVSSAADVFSNGYEAVYHLDETGNSFDNSAGTFDLANNGSTAATGRIGGGRAFDGTNDYASVDNVNLLRNTSQATISAWVRADTLAGSQILGVSVGDNIENPSRAALDIRSGEAAIYARADSTRRNANGGSPAADTWHHITGVIDYANDRIDVYVDGALVASESVSFDANTTRDENAGRFTIGAEELGTSDFFDGIIDEVRISDIARDADWVALQYAAQSNTLLDYGTAVTNGRVNANDNQAGTLQVVTDVSHGSLTLNADGSFSYTPHTDYVGLDFFEYRYDNAGDISETVRVDLRVREGNGRPTFVAPNSTIDTLPTVPVVFGATGTHPLSITDDAPAAHELVLRVAATSGTLTFGDTSGLVTSSGSGTTVDPFVLRGTLSSLNNALNGMQFASSNVGTETVTLIVNDRGEGESLGPALVATQTIDVRVTTPAAVTTTITGPTTVDEGTAVSLVATGTTGGVGPYTYDWDTNNDGTFNRTSAGGATATLNIDGSINTGPATRTVRVRVTDSLGATFIDSHTVTVNNVAPTVIDDALVIAEDGTLTMNTAALMANDSDPIDSLSFVSLAAPAAGNGTIVDNGDGTWTFNTAGQFDDLDSGEFRNVVLGYVVSDGTATATGNLTITVNGENDAPVLADATTSVQAFVANNTQVIDLADSDPDGDALTFAIVAGNTGGAFEVRSGGRIFVADSTALDPSVVSGWTLTVSASDGTATTTATVTISLNNQPPIAVDDLVTLNEDGSLTIDVLNNDSDPENGPLSTSLRMNASHGTVVRNVDGSFLYTPDANYHGSDSFTYDLSDGVLTATATVNITVNSINDLPVIATRSFSIAENSSNGTSLGFINATDIEDASVSYAIVGGTGGGNFAVNGTTGEITVTNQTGLDFETTSTQTLQVTATDSSGGQATETFTIQLQDANDPPVADRVRSFDIEFGETLNVPAANGLLRSASDPEGAPLQVILQQAPTHGTLTLNADGSFRYSNGDGTPDNFTVVISDGVNNSTLQTVRINTLIAAPAGVGGTGSNASQVSNSSSVSADSAESESTNNDAESYTATEAENSSDSSESTTTSEGDNAVESQGQEQAAVVADVIEADVFADTAANSADQNLLATPTATEDSSAVADSSDTANASGPAADSERLIDGWGERNNLDAGDFESSGQARTTRGWTSWFTSSETSIDLTDPNESWRLHLPPTQVLHSLDIVDKDIAAQRVFSSSVGTAAIATSSLTAVGYVVMAIRNGVLVTGLLAQMPAWRIIDPLVFLEALDEGDGESLESMIENHTSNE